MSLTPTVGGVLARLSTRCALLPRRTMSDHEFLAPALEILETPPSPVRIAMLVVICALLAATLAWASVGVVDIVATAQGKIQPIGRVKVIEPLETGRISRILAANGSRVKAGDVLIALDPAQAEAEVQTAELGLASITAEIARRTAAIAAARRPAGEPVPPIAWEAGVPAALRRREDQIYAADLSGLRSGAEALASQRLQKQAESDQLRSTMEAQRQLIATLQQRVDMRASLVQSKSGSKAALIDATETLQYQVTQLSLQKGQSISAERGIEVFARQEDKAVDDFISENAQKVSEAEQRAEQFGQSVAKARAALAHLTLTAPLNGTVQASVATNPGQVLTTGQEVMRIVPDGATLEAEVYVPNREIGFIKVGQDAIVKVEAFPFTRYGVINARVTHIADDAIPEPDAAQIESDPARPSNTAGYAGAQRTQNLVFPVRLSLDEAVVTVDGRDVPLTSGMTVTVDLRTGHRRILDYLFSPVLEISSQAMRER